jgi:hypothetical protein
MDLSDQTHRAYVRSVYKDHQEGSAKDLERFYQAQCLWDEGMAETLSEFLRRPENGRRSLLLPGRSLQFGIPSVFRNSPPLRPPPKNGMTTSVQIDIRFISVTRSGRLSVITQPEPSRIKRPSRSCHKEPRVGGLPDRASYSQAEKGFARE